jgi:hypothetical protein
MVLITSIPAFFSPDELSNLLSRPETVLAKEKLSDSCPKVSFSMSLDATTLEKINTMFSISSVVGSSVPFRWILGDTPMHADQSSSGRTSSTYLVYLYCEHDGQGDLVVQGEEIQMTSNLGVCFPEGMMHGTRDAEGARLLLGPMNVWSEPVGIPSFKYQNAINYYNTSADAAEVSGAGDSGSPITSSSNYNVGDGTISTSSSITWWEIYESSLGGSSGIVKKWNSVKHRYIRRQ